MACRFQDKFKLQKERYTSETIYRYIYNDNNLRLKLYKKLRRKHLYRIQRGKRKRRIPKELMIDNRPNRVNYRCEFGHWECDLMIFKRGTRCNLITLRERKTRYMIAIKNHNKTANGTAINLISTIKGMKSSIKSITFDQGSEFRKYIWIRDCLAADIYFCEPASPHQKGSIENGNGVIRTVLLREYALDALKQREINAIIKNINGRPLKCLQFKTPAEVFHENQLEQERI